MSNFTATAKALVVCLGAALLAACETAATGPAAAVGLPNPAAVACVESGGQHVVVKQSDGGEAGQCQWPSGPRCDAWAYFRGECAGPQGRRVKVDTKTPPAPRKEST